ncbi:MAG: hypothetical protein SLRJCFUN_001011, partial [Candidatus Fervidibacter sp.]
MLAARWTLNFWRYRRPSSASLGVRPVRSPRVGFTLIELLVV